MGFVFDSLSQRNVVLKSSWPEDQQRINTFSKLNNRVRFLEEKLTVLKVNDYPYAYLSVWDVSQQQEKEALDDLSTELELADEDQIVLCV